MRHENTRNRRLLELLRGGLLGIGAIRRASTRFPTCPRPWKIAAAAGNLESIMIRP